MGSSRTALYGQKESEGGRACYAVTATHRGHVIEIYASPDGQALLRKTEAFTLARWLDGLAALAIFVLPPGVAVGAVTRGVVEPRRAGRCRCRQGGYWRGSAPGRQSHL